MTQLSYATGKKLPGFLAFCVLALTPCAALAQDILMHRAPDRQQLLIEGAQKEKQVTIYSAAIVNQALRPLTDGFMKKYPFVRARYWRQYRLHRRKQSAGCEPLHWKHRWRSKCVNRHCCPAHHNRDKNSR